MIAASITGRSSSHFTRVVRLVAHELGVPLELVIPLVLLVGVLAGAFNALLIVRVGVPPLIMTLATLALYRGLAQGVSQARSVTGYPEWFFWFGQGNLFGLPVSYGNLNEMRRQRRVQLSYGELVAFYAYLLQLVLPIRRGGWQRRCARPPARRRTGR